MHYLIFTKRQLNILDNLKVRSTIPNSFGITTLFNQGNGLEVCMIQGEADQVYEAFAELELRPDLLVTQVLSGEMELPSSSVNTWLWRQYSRMNARTIGSPSH